MVSVYLLDATVRKRMQGNCQGTQWRQALRKGIVLRHEVWHIRRQQRHLWRGPLSPVAIGVQAVEAVAPLLDEQRRAFGEQL
jgi:hypothetical protein